MFMYYQNSSKVLFYDLSISSEEYAKYLIMRGSNVIDEDVMGFKDFVGGVQYVKIADETYIENHLEQNIGNQI